MMPTEPAPTLRLRLDAEALAGNWRSLDRLSGRARAGAAIKADAYGLGAARVAPLLQATGCESFFVAHWSEAAAVHALLPRGSVSVLHGPMQGTDLEFARATGAKPVINSLVQARLWRDGGGGPCDVMVDTGMNRLGLSLDQLGDDQVRGLDIDLLMSHLASAEDDSPLNALQCARWREACTALPHHRASLANSAGIALGEAFHGDLTRPGLALYGGVPCEALAGHLRQVAFPETTLLQIREVGAGETVGYNATFTAPRSMRIGTASLGYADGYLRAWSGRGVLRSMEGSALPVLGRVSMDLCVVDLSDAPEAREGDWLGVDYALPEAAAETGLSQYELLTLLGRRFAR